MEKAIDDNERIAAEAREDLQATEAEAATVTTLIDGIKNQISTANEEVGRLTERLGDLRKAHKQEESQSSASLQQLEAVLAKSYLAQKEDGKKKRHAPKPTPLSAEVFALQELGKKLSYSSGPEGSGGATSAPSFLQTGEADAEAGSNFDAGGDHADAQSGAEAIAVLQADKKDLVKAKKGAKKGFDEEEKQLIDLIRIQREELKKLEKSWEDQQPVVAEKLKQSAEINTTLAMAVRSLDRDKTLLPLTEDLCSFVAAGLEQEVKTRHELSNLVEMPTKLLESMDTGSFLAKDMESIRDLPPPSLVQVSAEASRKRRVRRRRRRSTRRAHHQAAAAASVTLSQAVRQALDSAAEQYEPATTFSLGGSKDDQAQEQARFQAGALAQGDALLQSSTAALTAGPFDKVSNMIGALIASLRDQINEDTDHHQMCEESTMQNQRTRLETKDNIDMMMTDIHWSETGISRLDSQIKAVEEDIPRLKATASAIQADFQAEKKRVEEETSDRDTSKEICSKVVVVLMELCELDDSDVAFTQENRTSVTSESRSGGGIVSLMQLRSLRSNRIKQCSEAAKLLNEAVAKFDELNNLAGDYIGAYLGKSDDAHGVASTMAQLRESDLGVTKASRAKRANELALARDFLKQKQHDLSLIEEEKMQLDQTCGPQVDSHDERMARRAEEIDSLKNALSVLEGEAVPVG
jgi:molybdopterin converting factor small subunit